MVKINKIVIGLLLTATLLGACAAPTPEPDTQPSVGVPNPASVNCEDKGGQVLIEKRGDGGEYGICIFEDNMQCEEWAFMRGECPFGGVKVTGYVTPASRYCAITGGEYSVTGNSNAENEQETCKFTNGKSCDVWEYYNGKCDAN
jgi:putative hemolysin